MSILHLRVYLNIHVECTQRLFIVVRISDSFDEDTSEEHESIAEHDLKVAAAKWIMRNREGHRIPHSVMESIVAGAQSLYEIALSKIQDRVIGRMKETDIASDIISSVSSVFDSETQYTSIFKGLETTYRQNMFIKDNLDLLYVMLA